MGLVGIVTDIDGVTDVSVNNDYYPYGSPKKVP